MSVSPLGEWRGCRMSKDPNNNIGLPAGGAPDGDSSASNRIPLPLDYRRRGAPQPKPEAQLRAKIALLVGGVFFSFIATAVTLAAIQGPWAVSHSPGMVLAILALPSVVMLLVCVCFTRSRPFALGIAIGMALMLLLLGICAVAAPGI